MNKELLEKLKKWQAERARRDNVEAYRVLPYKTLEDIARREPQTPEELLEVKGIKEKKLARYGKEILAIVNEENGKEIIYEIEKEDKVFEVGEYINFLNEKLLETEARIKGEVSSVDDRGNYLFFKIQDRNGESLINCFVWKNDYQISGIELEIGMEIMIWGYPRVYPVNGQLSFQTKLIELVGEGALKKAYEELKRKLEAEGIFRPERKKPIPDLSHNIGLITSHQGAAIGDFTTNLGSYGFKIKFYNSRVEGKQAVFDLVKAVKWFNKNMPDLDALAIVRGGGSLESLQAFNTESLVREVADSKIPVLAGIGHEKDISLAALAADKMVSTPTAAAMELTRSWNEAAQRVNEAERNLLSYLSGIFERFEKAKHVLQLEMEKIGQAIFYGKERAKNFSKNISAAFLRVIENIKERIRNLDGQLKIHNPERQLKLGYSLVSAGGKIVRSVRQVETGEKITTKVSDGEFDSEVKKIKT